MKVDSLIPSALTSMTGQLNGSTVIMSSNASGLTVVWKITPSSDNRLKFNEKPILNAVAIINRLETVEYEQT